MKYYNRIKNLALAFLVGFIYYKYIVPSIPVLDKLFALVYVCTMVLYLLENLDAKKRAKVRAKRNGKECAGSLGENRDALKN
jgi:hypothetical protein